MRALFLLVALATQNSFALEEFSAEEHFPVQEPVPLNVVADLTPEIDLEKSGCEERNVAETLEATKIRLSSRANTLLVKPKAWCLCGAYYCPVWIYQLQPTATRLWSTKGTSGVEILAKTSKGYRQIKESGGTAGHSYMRVWSWDGMKYKVIKEKYLMGPQN